MTRAAVGAGVRVRRLAAACVRAAPLLPPVGLSIGLAATGEARGMGGIGIAVLLVGWLAAGAVVTLIWLFIDWLRLGSARPPLAFAYAGLEVEDPRPLRQGLAGACVVVLPALAGWAASAACSAKSTCSLDLETELLWSTPIGLWAFNWLFWLGPSARTLGDRLAGGRLRLSETDTNATAAPRRLWPDVALLAPPLLGIAVSGGNGGSAGLLVAALILAMPVWVTRRARRAAA